MNGHLLVPVNSFRFGIFLPNSILVATSSSDFILCRNRDMEREGKTVILHLVAECVVVVVIVIVDDFLSPF